MFTTHPITLKVLLDEVTDGKIQLPDFQRGWVWDDDRIKGLLVSISRGFPVGAIMTLSADGEIQFQTRPIEGVELNGRLTPPEVPAGRAAASHLPLPGPPIRRAPWKPGIAPVAAG